MKKAVAFLVVFQILTSTFTANAAYVGEKYISSSGACVMDCETGDVLYEYCGNTPRVPASMTKLMTMYCVYTALANGEISLDTPVPISSNVYYKSRNQLYQNMLPLNYNTTYTVNELIDVVVSYSASASTVALAELIGGGSESAFVRRMNETAQNLGISAYYYDSCGVADNSITPVSMAKLARRLINDYPDILNRSSKKSVTFHGGTYKTTNHLLDTCYYEGADGLKTGTGNAAGACFCGTAVRNGRRIITVTMGSSSSWQRFVDTTYLLDYGFAAAEDKYNSVYHTDMKAFVNGTEMPAFYYNGKEPHEVIIAEDMANYGFDVTYDDMQRTLYIKRNTEKEINPIALDVYKNKNGIKAFGVRPSNIKVVIGDGEFEHTFEDVYNVGGYMCISVDEFALFYDFVWNSAEAAAYINTVIHTNF